MKENTKEMKEVEISGVKIQYTKEIVRIVDSTKVKKTSDMLEILRVFRYWIGYGSKRSLKSWVKEWKAHNRLYRLGLFRSHTRDCDLEENEKIHRLIAYQILGI